MFKKALLITLGVLIGTSYGSEVETEEGVLVLNDDNFDSVIAENQHILVEFYAPWCGHCQQLAPEYAKAAQSLASQNLHLAKVDATVNNKLAERFGIQGFPTIYWFKNGVHSEYNGGRSENDIVNWVLKRSGPPSNHLGSCEELKERASQARLALAYIGDLGSRDFSTVFMSVAENPNIGEKYQFFHTSDFEGCGGVYGSDKPTVVLFRKFDESPIVYKGAISNVDALLVWLQTQSTPTLIEFSEEYIEPIFGQRKLTISLFRSNEDADTQFSQVFAETARALKGQLLFVTSGVRDGIQGRLAEFLGVDEYQIPTIRLMKPDDDMKKFSYEGSIYQMTVETLTQFIEDYNQGRLQPSLKSQEIPEDDGRALKTIVGKNFREKVLESGNEVFIKFYAPWCGHCKSMAPAWEQLAEELRQVEGLVIADFDATANEAEGVNIQGFPTLKFYKNGVAQDFDGDRQIEGFKEYLKQNSAAYQRHISSQKLSEEL